MALDMVKDGAAGYGVRLTAEQEEQFDRCLLLLQGSLRRMNLVSDATDEAVQRRHFLESIALGAALRERQLLRPGASVLDVGAGAGFPGVVLKIVWPSIALALIEATAKKADFLRELAAALGLDMAVRTGRAETLAHDPELRGRFDLVLARAVAPLPALLELTLPFARVGGHVVTPKGSRRRSGAAGRALGAGGRAFTFRCWCPGHRRRSSPSRATTPEAYPRRPGVPGRSPL
jgi:16S rRNA (guanine527-N7)-methyltransferase